MDLIVRGGVELEDCAGGIPEGCVEGGEEAGEALGGGVGGRVGVEEPLNHGNTA